MKNDGSQPPRIPWLTWVRLGLFILAGLIANLWIASYFIGLQRYHSDWEETETVSTENAHWWMSNQGAFGYGWRTQRTGPQIEKLPADEVQWATFDSSPSALNHIHPEGFLAWHWFEFHPEKITLKGTSKSYYGHLFVPYWLPLSLCLLAAFLIPVRKKHAENGVRSSDADL